jgi:hypothetical protein
VSQRRRQSEQVHTHTRTRSCTRSCRQLTTTCEQGGRHRTTLSLHTHTCAMCMRPDGSKPSYATGLGLRRSSSRSSGSGVMCVRVRARVRARARARARARVRVRVRVRVRARVRCGCSVWWCVPGGAHTPHTHTTLSSHTCNAFLSNAAAQLEALVKSEAVDQRALTLSSLLRLLLLLLLVLLPCCCCCCCCCCRLLLLL